MATADLRIADFDYELPDSRIARHPQADRAGCRLIGSAPDGTIAHHRFRELPGLLKPGDLLVMNNTRVINARLEFRKATGARIEVFLLEPSAPADYALNFAAKGRCRWKCLVGNRKRWKEGSLEKKPGEGGAVLRALITGPDEVELSWEPQEASFAEVLEAAGRIPIPPYLNRDSEEADSTDYQTVYSKVKGSVAAPTAGLHFTPGLLDELRSRGVETGELTLHVGAGTFQPVKSERIGDHPMHTETFSVSLELLQALSKALREGRTITAAGTTTVRTLESLPYLSRAVREGRDPHVGQWEAYSGAGIDAAEALDWLENYMKANGLQEIHGSTAIMIAPGFRWKLTGQMITNFHQPQSTLLLLVSSFLEPEGSGAEPQWRRIYREALDGDYRFLSYGDACLLHPRKS